MSRDIRHLIPSSVSDHLKEFQGVIRPTSSSYRLEFVSTIAEKTFWRSSTGVTVIEPEASASAEEYFYILVEYEFDLGHKFDTRELVSNLPLPKTDSVYKKILERIQQLEHQPHTLGQRKFRYTLGVSRAQIEEAGGAVYLRDLDIIVGFDKYRDDVLHPYSSGGIAKLLSKNFIHDAEGLTQRYLFVDNTGSQGSRWINTWYGVFELKPFANPQIDDGIHITVNCMGKRDPYTEHLTLAEAEEKLGLQKSKSEAECFGRADVVTKAKQAENERELLSLKHQLAVDKLALDRERDELDREKERRKEQIKEEDARRERERKDHDDMLRRERDAMEVQKERLRQEFQHDEMRYKLDSEARKRQYEFEKMDRSDRSEYTKAMIDIAKGVLSLATIGLSIYAVVQKGKK
jgi:hypothetical protein